MRRGGVDSRLVPYAIRRVDEAAGVAAVDARNHPVLCIPGVGPATRQCVSIRFVVVNICTTGKKHVGRVVGVVFGTSGGILLLSAILLVQVDSTALSLNITQNGA